MTIEKVKTAVLEVLDRETRPERMTKSEYVEFLEDLITDLEIRLEAAEDDLDGR